MNVLREKVLASYFATVQCVEKTNMKLRLLVQNVFQPIARVFLLNETLFADPILLYLAR